MELLNNLGLMLKPEGLLHLHFHEFRALIESIIELCQKGEISFYEAKDTIGLEWSHSMMYIELLRGKLFELEFEEDDGDVRFNMDFGFLDKTDEKKLYKNVLDEMRNYRDFVVKSERMLKEIPERKKYQENRKANIKQQIIQDGLSSLLVNTGNINEQEYKTNINESLRNVLFLQFPKFEKDMPLLEKHDFLEIDDAGLHWKKSKQSLAEYFKSIKPEKMKNVPWKILEDIFGEKDLKHSGSPNGNSNTEGSNKKRSKKISKDFEKWLEIKNTPSGK